MDSRRFPQSRKIMFIFRISRNHANLIDISDHFTQSCRNESDFTQSRNFLSDFTHRVRIPSDVITHKIIFSRHHSKIADKEYLSCNHTHLWGRGGAARVLETSALRKPISQSLILATLFHHCLIHKLSKQMDVIIVVDTSSIWNRSNDTDGEIAFWAS